jgi:hypothetical protein
MQLLHALGQRRPSLSNTKTRAARSGPGLHDRSNRYGQYVATISPVPACPGELE